jgi:pimeloyl-ACP methyl ester carboxylesterase
MEPKNLAKASVAGIVDQLGAIVGRAPHYMPAVGEPGTYGVMTTPDAAPGFAAMNPAGSKWENRVAARIALHVGTYRPGRAAAKIAGPVLFCICDNDTLTPADTAAKYAARVPKGEVKRYPVGHFEIYIGEPFEQAVSDQTEFLVRHLLG